MQHNYDILENASRIAKSAWNKPRFLGDFLVPLAVLIAVIAICVVGDYLLRLHH